MNLSKLSTTTGALSPTQSLAGYNFGGVLDIAIDSNFSFQPGFLVSTKGGNNSYYNYSSYVSSNITLNYLEIPINLLYNVHAGTEKVFFGGGPYLGYGLSSSNTTSSQTAFGNGPFEFRTIDLGVNFMIGYKLKQGLAFDFNYGLGLSDLNNSGNSSDTRNRVIGISLGYFFK